MKKRIVIKLGTGVLSTPTGKSLDTDQFMPGRGNEPLQAGQADVAGTDEKQPHAGTRPQAFIFSI